MYGVFGVFGLFGQVPTCAARLASVRPMVPVPQHTSSSSAGLSPAAAHSPASSYSASAAAVFTCSSTGPGPHKPPLRLQGFKVIRACLTSQGWALRVQGAGCGG